jgi:hypothetical protein
MSPPPLSSVTVKQMLMEVLEMQTLGRRSLPHLELLQFLIDLPGIVLNNLFCDTVLGGRLDMDQPWETVHSWVYLMAQSLLSINQLEQEREVLEFRRRVSFLFDDEDSEEESEDNSNSSEPTVAGGYVLRCHKTLMDILE